MKLPPPGRPSTVLASVGSDSGQCISDQESLDHQSPPQLQRKAGNKYIFTVFSEMWALLLTKSLWVGIQQPRKRFNGKHPLTPHFTAEADGGSECPRSHHQLLVAGTRIQVCMSHILPTQLCVKEATSETVRANHREWSMLRVPGSCFR